MLSCRSLLAYVQINYKSSIEHSVSPHHDHLAGRKGHQVRILSFIEFRYHRSYMEANLLVQDRVHFEHWF